MALIVQKFGGTSVGTIERIAQVADKVKKFRENGDDIVVVCCCDGTETVEFTSGALLPARFTLNNEGKTS